MPSAAFNLASPPAVMIYCKVNKPSWLPELKLAFNFACEYFNLNPKKVKVYLDYLPPSRYGEFQNGFFVHLGSNPIAISIEKLLDGPKAIEVLFHELTHWWQCVNGAFDKGNEYYFEKWYSLDKIQDYFNHPSEVEARSKAFLLMQKWAEIRRQKLKEVFNK